MKSEEHSSQAGVRGELCPRANPTLAQASSHEPKLSKQSGGINYLSLSLPGFDFFKLALKIQLGKDVARA